MSEGYRQIQKQKLRTMDFQGIKADNPQNNVCLVIPVYQQEIASLKSKLAYKTALCERIEEQKGRLTFEINKHKLEKSEYITRMEVIQA